MEKKNVMVCKVNAAIALQSLQVYASSNSLASVPCTLARVQKPPCVWLIEIIDLNLLYCH